MENDCFSVRRTRREGASAGTKGAEDAEDVVGAPGPELPPVELDLVAVGMDAQPGGADDPPVGVEAHPALAAQPVDEISCLGRYEPAKSPGRWHRRGRGEVEMQPSAPELAHRWAVQGPSRSILPQPDDSERVGAHGAHTQSGPMRVHVASRSAIGSKATSASSTI